MADRGPAGIGRTVAHYEILEKLGGGGMGVVYKARDLRLGRLAALKFLPAHLDSQDDRRRFLNEARAASSLDHPNICTVYEIGETGEGEGGLFIAMACCEGETLKKKIQRGTLKIDEAIDYTLQIAAGLSRAHSQGIVHRDIKPANLMITSDGQVKIVDFGIAKLASETGLTRFGVAIGTPAYMSPEQILGEPVDHRTDIWSLGVVLYEMLAGRLPFESEDDRACAYAILHQAPRPIRIRRPEAPPELEQILGKALERSPADRYQHVDEIPVDLRALRRSGSHPMLATGTTVVAVPQPSASARRVPKLKWKRLATAAALLMALIIAGLLRVATARQMGVSRAERPPTFKVLTYERGTINRARFAPDGQTIVFGASWNGEPFRVYQTRLGSPVSSPIELPPADLLAVSRTGELAVSLDHEFPNGTRLGLGTLARAPLLGGVARRLQERITDADWAPDGSGLAIVRKEGVGEWLEYPIGRMLHRVGGHISRVRFSRDGTRIAFLEHPVMDWSGSVVVVDLRTGKIQRLSEGWQSLRGLAWSASGDEIWVTGSRGWNPVLAAVRLDGSERVLHSFPADVALLDVASDGRALLARQEVFDATKLLLPGETRERDLSWLDGAVAVDISEDGKKLLLSHRGEGSGPFYSVYLRDIDGTSSVLLGEGTADDISPDGRWVVSLVPGERNRILLLPTGAGRTQSRKVALDVSGSGGFFPDSRRLVLMGRENGRQSRCYVLDMTNGALRPITPEGSICGVYKSPVSPDGKFVVGWDYRSAALYPVEGGPPRKIPYRREEWFVRWDSTGQALFTVRPTGTRWPIYRLEIATGRRELWKEIEAADRTGIQQVSYVHLTPDGRTVVYCTRRTLSKLYLVEGLE
jgi:eukaryotic-like serine/threonine-protein kinase